MAVSDSGPASSDYASTRIVLHQIDGNALAEPGQTGSKNLAIIDVIDLHLLHRVDARVRIEDTVGKMAELVRPGNRSIRKARAKRPG